MTEFPNIVVVLVEPETPGNIGFVARVMANFGVTQLRIAGEDLRNHVEAQRYAVHAVEILENAQVFGTLEDALQDMSYTWAATARAGRNHSVTRALVPLPELPDPFSVEGNLAIVFGRESSGLTNEEVDLCDLAFSIPTSEEYPSMNLSHAVGVTLYQLYSEYVPEEPRQLGAPRVASPREREQASIFFDETVEVLPIKEFRKPIAKRVFRNLLGRAYMTGREVTTLTGIIRKIRDLILGKDKNPQKNNESTESDDRNQQL